MCYITSLPMVNCGLLDRLFTVLWIVLFTQNTCMQQHAQSHTNQKSNILLGCTHTHAWVPGHIDVLKFLPHIVYICLCVRPYGSMRPARRLNDHSPKSVINLRITKWAGVTLSKGMVDPFEFYSTNSRSFFLTILCRNPLMWNTSPLLFLLGRIFSHLLVRISKSWSHI